MIVCQWHLDIPYGKQGEALAIIRAWVLYRVRDERQG